MHDDVLLLLLSLALLLGVARGLGDLARRLGVPAVVGEIVAGLVVGKTILGRLSPPTFAWLFGSEGAKALLGGYTTVAVILLMVASGLEIDLNVVRRSSRAVVLTSALGVAVPLALGIGSGLLLSDVHLPDPNRRLLHAVFLGIALSISALPVIARTLIDLGLLKTDLGLIVLSAAAFDDLIGWTGFGVLSREFSGSTGTGIARVATSVGLTALFVVVALVAVRPIADRLLGRLQSPGEPSSGRVLSMIMVLAFLGAAATEALGMHAVFGAFVMGLAVGDSPRLREHTRHVLMEFVTSVFTPVFFATMALRIDFIAQFDGSLVALILTIAFVAKIVGCTAGARLGGVAWRQALAVGFGMNSRGAMEILLAALALEAGIVSAQMFVALVVMAIVTSLVSGPAMARILRPPPSPVLRLLREGVVLLDPPAGDRGEGRQAALDRRAVIERLAGALAERLGRAGDASRFAVAALAREELSGTGVGEGVAIPHAEIEGLDRTVLAFGRTAVPLDFDAPDGAGVRLVFLLLTPPRAFAAELAALAAIVHLVHDPTVRDALLGAPDRDAVLSTLADADRAAQSRAAASARARAARRDAPAPPPA